MVLRKRVSLAQFGSWRRTTLLLEVLRGNHAPRTRLVRGNSSHGGARCGPIKNPQTLGRPLDPCPQRIASIATPCVCPRRSRGPPHPCGTVCQSSPARRPLSRRTRPLLTPYPPAGDSRCGPCSLCACCEIQQGPRLHRPQSARQQRTQRSKKTSSE